MYEYAAGFKVRFLRARTCPYLDNDPKETPRARKKAEKVLKPKRLKLLGLFLLLEFGSVAGAVACAVARLLLGLFGCFFWFGLHFWLLVSSILLNSILLTLILATDFTRLRLCEFFTALVLMFLHRNIIMDY